VARLASKAEADEIDVRRADVLGVSVREIERGRARVCVCVCVRMCTYVFYLAAKAEANV